MNTARKLTAPAHDFAPPKSAQKGARAKGKPVKRRYMARLSGQAADAAVLIDGAESHTDAAIAFAERAAVDGRKLSVLVTECQSGASCSFVLDLEGGSIGS